MSSEPAVFDEMGWPDHIRAPYALIDAWLKSIPAELLALKRREAEVLFRRIGITFAVYTEGGDSERITSRPTGRRSDSDVDPGGQQ